MSRALRRATPCRSTWRPASAAIALGFGLAALVGVPLGLLMGWYRWLDDIVTPLFDGLRFIAPMAWVPFAALWFGTGIGGPMMIIFAGAFPPCLINAYRGARWSEPPSWRPRRCSALGGCATIPRCCCRRRCRRSSPACASGAGLGWQSLVGAELIVASGGIGYMMVQAQGEPGHRDRHGGHGGHRRGRAADRCGAAPRRGRSAQAQS